MPFTEPWLDNYLLEPERQVPKICWQEEKENCQIILGNCFAVSYSLKRM